MNDWLDYESVSSSSNLSACLVCGAVVRDQETHTDWHNERGES